MDAVLPSPLSTCSVTQDLCTMCSQFSGCYCLFWLISIKAGFLLSASLPAKIPTPASHLAPAKAQAVAVSVLEGQEPLAAGWTTSMVYLGSIHQNRNISKRHICRELHSLYLKTDCPELYKGPEPRGNAAKLPLSGTQYHTEDGTLVFIDLTFDMQTPKVHYQSNWQYYQGMHSDYLYGIVDKAKQNREHIDYRIFI